MYQDHVERSEAGRIASCLPKDVAFDLKGNPTRTNVAPPLAPKQGTLFQLHRTGRTLTAREKARVDRQRGSASAKTVVNSTVSAGRWSALPGAYQGSGACTGKASRPAISGEACRGGFGGPPPPTGGAAHGSSRGGTPEAGGMGGLLLRLRP